MTSYHQLTLSWIGNYRDMTREEIREQDQLLIRGSAEAATRCNAVVWISERGDGFYGDDEEPLGAVIPAKLARELIEEGRLNHPPLASITVLA